MKSGMRFAGRNHVAIVEVNGVKRRMVICFVGILILVMVASVPTAAQSGVAAGPLFGLCKAQDADGYRIFGGAAMRFRLSDVFGVEGSINYGGEDYDKGTVEVKSLPVMITGLQESL
jgi:hypothetical protein